MLDRSLAEHARKQHGLVTDRELDDHGITEHERRARIESGALERLNGKVLAVAGAPRTWSQRAAAVLMAVPGSALGFESAARVLGIPWYQEHDAITISAPLAAHHFVPGIEIRRTGRLPESHIAETRGLRHTTLARTLIDLALVTRERRLQEVIEGQLGAKRITWDELESTFCALAGRGRPGIARARRVLQTIEGRPPTESKLERMYVDLLTGTGVALPTMQVTAPWAERRPGRVDGMWVEAKSIVELDGRKFHVRNAEFENDRRRDQLALVRGYETARFTYLQIRNESDHVIEVSRYLSTRS